MSLSVSIRHRQGGFELEAAFVSEGRLTALFGPSGSGKTSLVNIIAGLVHPDEGRVEAGGRVLVDTAARIFLPPHRRRIGYVFQDGRLFRHLTVAQNLAYGRFFTPRSERYASFERVVEMLGISHLLDRRPAKLSGGEKQRVAIGRALIASPRLILMDEPLAALDDDRKAEILPYIERLRDEAEIPIVYVSHSLAEVARLATDVVMVAGGRIAASGPAAELVARLDLMGEEDRGEAGALVELEVIEHDERYGLSVMRSAGATWRMPRVAASVGARLRARVRARDVMVATEPPANISALNVLEGAIAEVTPGAGADAMVALDCGGDRILARLTRRSVDALGLAPGRKAYAVVKTIAFDRTVAPFPAPRKP